MSTVAEINAVAHANAAAARVITEVVATCRCGGGPGADIYFYFALPSRCRRPGAGVTAWIDPETVLVSCAHALSGVRSDGSSCPAQVAAGRTNS